MATYDPMNSVNSGKKVKMVFVVRDDLDMSLGKVASQVVHANTSLIMNRLDAPIWWERYDTWDQTGRKTVTLAANDEDTLVRIVNKCQQMKVPHVTIRDAGLTQVEEGTFTVVGIGPLDEQTAKKITGSLKLL